MSAIEVTISNKVISILDRIIDDALPDFRESESFKVRPGYGYDKFYLDRVDGDYDMSLQSLVHYILYEEGFYAEFLSEAQLKEVEALIEENPEAIYCPYYDDEVENNAVYVIIIDRIHSSVITHVAKRLIAEGFSPSQELLVYAGTDGE